MTDFVLEPMVYLAGPYTNPDPVANTSHAITVANYIEEMFGVAVVVPHLTLLSHLIIPRNIDHWYAYDLQILARCDALVRIPGASTGADNEVEFAKGRGIPVFFSDQKNFANELRTYCTTIFGAP